MGWHIRCDTHRVRKQVLAPFFLLVAALVAYHNSVAAPFVFDDLRVIVANERIRNLWPIWTPLLGSSRPLVQLSLAINFAMSGYNVWSYHLTNLLVHWAAACVLLGTLRRILDRNRLAAVRINKDGLAFAIALLWIVHPIQTESVTYVIQRGESMAALFCLLTLYCFLRSFESSATVMWRTMSVVAFLGGVASKSIAVVAPCAVLICDSTLIAGSIRDAFRVRPRYYMALFAPLAVLPLFLSAQPADWSGSAGLGIAGVSPVRYAASQPRAILRYLELTFWPNDLCLDYGWPPAEDAIVITLAATFILTLLALSIWACWRKSSAGLAGVFFFLLLAPTSSFIPVADLIVEHRMYLPLATVISLVVSGSFLAVDKLSERFEIRRRKSAVLIFAASAATMLLTLLTIVRNDEYRSEILLWTRATEVSPLSARAQYDLGTVLMRSHQFDVAAEHLRRATEIRPTYQEAYYNLGNVQLAQGQPVTAAASFRRALALSPSDWQAHNNLGVALLHIGNVSDAVAEFGRALRLNPECSSAQTNLRKASGTVPK
jgi:tetratricopeptide (TPR) repeat protein